jgi:DNA-binding MarR family transcriptional regulator
MSRRVNNIVAAFVLDVGQTMIASVERVAGQSGALAPAVTYLLQEPDIGVEQLRAVLGLSQPATVRLVNQLVAEGLATRTRHEGDGRRVHLRLTDAGQARAREILDARLGAVGEFLDRVTPGDREALVSLVGRLYTAAAPDAAAAERICRLCDLRACPERSCPVGRAVVG